MLAKKLTFEFGAGFLARNLWYMRNFYLFFPKLNAVRSELTWTHYRLLMRVENKQARGFYEIECINNRWSTRELERQINSLLEPFLQDVVNSARRVKDRYRVKSSLGDIKEAKEALSYAAGCMVPYPENEKMYKLHEKIEAYLILHQVLK